MQVLRNDLYRPWFQGEDWGIEIIDGEFSGLVVQFKSVEFSKQVDSSVDVDYHIINQSDFPETDTSSEVFSNLLEVIINDILKEAMDHYEQTRDNDSQEPGQ